MVAEGDRHGGDDERREEEHDHVAEHGSHDEREAADRRDPQALDHAAVELEDDSPACAHAGAEGNQAEDAGQEDVEDAPGREAGTAAEPVQDGSEQREVEQRCRQAHEEPGRLPPRLEQLAHGEEPDVAHELHAACSSA